MFKGKLFKILLSLIFLIPLLGFACIFGDGDDEEEDAPQAYDAPSANISGSSSETNNISGSES